MKNFRLAVTWVDGSVSIVEHLDATWEELLQAVKYVYSPRSGTSLEWVGPGELITTEAEIEGYQNEIMRLESLLEDAREGKDV